MTNPVSQEPWFLDIIEVFRGIKTVVTEVVSGLDLSMTHYVALRILEHCGSCTMSELTEQLNVTHGAATGTIDRLERDGFVARSHSPTDRRVVHVALTPAGSELLLRASGAICDDLGRLVDTRGPQGRTSIALGFSEFASAFRAIRSHSPVKDKACR